MVMSFRVSDLQMLLGFVGRSKSGLKHELVTRALQLVQFDCSPEVFKKIKELYETRYAKKSSEAPQPHRSPEALPIHSSYERGSAVPRTSISTPNIDYPTLYGKYLNGLGRLPPKAVKPEVRLVKLPFYTTLDELLKPTELGEFSVCCVCRVWAERSERSECPKDWFFKGLEVGFSRLCAEQAVHTVLDVTFPPCGFLPGA